MPVTNRDRAIWALGAVEVFAEETGLDLECDGLDTAISDLLADMYHLCKQNDLDLDDLLERGRWHFIEELAEEKEESVS